MVGRALAAPAVRFGWSRVAAAVVGVWFCWCAGVLLCWSAGLLRCAGVQLAVVKVLSDMTRKTPVAVWRSNVRFVVG